MPLRSQLKSASYPDVVVKKGSLRDELLKRKTNKPEGKKG